ncbi:alpha/beta fold hydrolase [Hymenobacter sp. BT664]|uniref:Alpha/beta fold hydrolase n=1 Tax=Hymenobacter montanus TaxID=2771359 RepID=A0A927GII4_9BACT|nr:alpha/beta fold hydrolase [Hymenobacter montanus]MBD2767427.1 alpha/beta fold hydrolase [Hymenobacter montanus]
MPKALPLALHGLHFFYRFLSPGLPGLAVRLMWQTFRPRRRPLRAEQSQLLAGAELFSFTSAGALTSKTIRLQGYRWGTGPRTVLLVHGWEGNPADFRELVPGLLRQGYAVAAFDLPAHGRSEGAETNLVEMKQALVDYTHFAGQPYAVVAHSLGGTAAALLLQDAAAPVEKFVFVASPLSAPDAFEMVFTQLQVPQSVRRRFYQRLARHLRQPVEDIAFAPVERLRAHRLLAVYDATDERVVFERVQLYLAANAAIEPLVVSGVGHNRLLRHAPVVQRITDFIEA